MLEVTFFSYRLLRWSFIFSHAIYFESKDFLSIFFYLFWTFSILFCQFIEI